MPRVATEGGLGESDEGSEADPAGELLLMRSPHQRLTTQPPS